MQKDIYEEVHQGDGFEATLMRTDTGIWSVKSLRIDGLPELKPRDGKSNGTKEQVITWAEREARG